MCRGVATFLVALAALDYFYLDGKYLHSVQAVANSLLHFFLRWLAARKRRAFATEFATQLLGKIDRPHYAAAGSSPMARFRRADALGQSLCRPYPAPSRCTAHKKKGVSAI